jgi:7-cyano-7-deazaguanine synthase
MTQGKEKCVVVLSGGQDSTTCLYYAINRGYEVHAITFDYGQRHRCEILSAQYIARLAQIASHRIVTLGQGITYEGPSGDMNAITTAPSGILEGTSPLVDPSAQLEQYADHHSLPGGLEKTFVPMRNQLFFTIAANRAFVLGSNTIVTGISSEDYGGYPDCREGFLQAFVTASNRGTFTDRGMRILAPLLRKNKADTVRFAMEFEGCYEALAFSHTSYDGEYPPRGHDHATLLRAKGFEEAGIPDPLLLRAVIEGAMRLSELPQWYSDVPDFWEFNARVERVLDAQRTTGPNRYA